MEAMGCSLAGKIHDATPIFQIENIYILSKGKEGKRCVGILHMELLFPHKNINQSDATADKSSRGGSRRRARSAAAPAFRAALVSALVWFGGVVC